MKQSQRQWVTAQLLTRGKVTRNQALKRYISRLASIICDLKKAGWEIHTSRDKGDYVYSLILK